MPMAMGTSSRGSNFFTMPRNSRTQAITSIMALFQFSPWKN
jgi:hypothetical protein